MPFPTYYEGLGLGLVHLGHTSSPRNSSVTLVPKNFLFQKEGRRTASVGGHHSQQRSALPSPPYPAWLDSPADSAPARASAATATVTAMTPLSHPRYFIDPDTTTYSATTTPLSPPSPTLIYSIPTSKSPSLPSSFEANEANCESLPSLSQLFMPPQTEFAYSRKQQRQSLPSFRQFVHQTHSPETPQSAHFTSSTHDRRNSLPSFSQLVAQIQEPSERRRLPSFADMVAGAPVVQSRDNTLFDNCEDDRRRLASEDVIVAETPRPQRQPLQVPQYGDVEIQQSATDDTISMLAAAAAELERDFDSTSSRMAGPISHSIPLTTAYSSPATTNTSLSTDVSAKSGQGQLTSTGANRNTSNTSWLWRRPSDDRWVQRNQASPPKRDRSDEYNDYDTVLVKREDDTEAWRRQLPPKKRKSSLTSLASSSGSRPLKRSVESTDDTRSEIPSEGDDSQQPTKTKKKRMSKPKDPNYVSPSGFRHGGERRVQEPDEVVDIPADVGPVSMLKGPNLPKVTWKGTPLPVEGKPGADRLHPHEAYIASTLRLSPAQYLLCKKTLILASREFQSNHKVFRKTDAQKLCHVDVNKASKLWEIFTKIGWLAGGNEEDA